MEIPSLPTQSPVMFFSSLLFFAPSKLSECLEQIISPESVTSVILSPPHPPIPRGNHFNQSDREKRSSTGSSAWAVLPTRMTAPAFLTEFAIEWTPKVSRTQVKLPTLLLSCKCRLLIIIKRVKCVYCCRITKWRRNVFGGTEEPGSEYGCHSVCIAGCQIKGHADTNK